MVLMEQRLQENKILQQEETHKKIETQLVKNNQEQNDKAQQLLMQKNEIQAQQNQQAVDSAALQHAAKLAAVQMGSIVRAGVGKNMDAHGVIDVVQRGMNPIDRQIAGLGNGDRNIPRAPSPSVAPPMPTSAPSKDTPAPEKPQSQEVSEPKVQPLARQGDERQGGAADAIARSAVHVPVADAGLNNQPQSTNSLGKN